MKTRHSTKITVITVTNTFIFVLDCLLLVTDRNLSMAVNFRAFIVIVLREINTKNNDNDKY